MAELRIRGDFGSGEILCRLEQARRTPKFTKLHFVGINFDCLLVKAVKDIFSSHAEQEDRRWERVSLSMCRGAIRDVIHAIDNVDEFRYYEDQLEPPRSTPFEILSSATLQEVSFENMAVTMEHGSVLANYLARNEIIDSFSLCCARVEPEAVAELAGAFRSNRSLTTIRMSNCSLDDDHVSCILKSVATNQHLKKLSIDGNKCQNRSMEALVSLLQQANSSLIEIDVSHQEGGITAESFSALLSSLRSNRTLNALRMRNNNLQNEHLRVISDMLCENSTIIDVDLRFNAFTSDGIKGTIAANLPRYKGLRLLQIRTGSGVLRKDLSDALVEGLENNWRLLCMDLFEWEPRIQHCLNLNRSNRLLLRDDGFPLALWPLMLERCMKISEQSVQGPFQENKLRKQKATRKASALFYFLRNSSTLLHGT